MKVSQTTQIFLIWIFAVFISFYLGFFTLPHSEKFKNDFWISFANWDGGHYTGIAKNGYSEKFQYAFFPLYPLLIKTAGSVLGSYLLAGVLISFVSTFLATRILYKLIKEDFNKQIAQKSVTYFLFFPTSFFLLTVYSEGLFFLLIISAFYYYKKRNFIRTAVFLALASAARLAGLAAIAAILFEILTNKGFNKNNIFILFAPLGFILYSVFLYYQTGDPFYFITAENHWQRALATPAAAFIEVFRTIPSGLIDLIFTVFGLGFAIRAFRFLPSSYAVYALLSVVIPLFTPTLSSMPRFLLPVFPVFILIALLENDFFAFSFETVSIMLLGIFSAIFAAGYWVA